MSKTTRATQALTKAGVVFTVHTYDYDPGADRVGIQTLAKAGYDPLAMADFFARMSREISIK